MRSAPKAFECGTTTLLGGCLVQTEQAEYPWAFFCLGVGDCKAYKISIKQRSVTVSDISSGSRGEGGLDKRDCGYVRDLKLY